MEKNTVSDSSSTTLKLRGASAKALEWHHIDASTAPLGRVATKIASLLMGKHRSDYAAHQVAPVYVVVTHTDTIVVTGRKEEQKMYYKYSGYPGGMRARALKDQRGRDSRKIMEAAVFGMLPKNKLRNEMMKHMKLYPGADHPHMPQLGPQSSAVNA